MNSNSKHISTTNDVPHQFSSTCNDNADPADSNRSATALDKIPHEQHQADEESKVPFDPTQHGRRHSWIGGKSQDQSRIPFKKRHLFHPTPNADVACLDTSSSLERPDKKQFLDYLALSRNPSPSPRMLLSASLLETPRSNPESPPLSSLSAHDEALSSTFSNSFFDTPRLTQATPGAYSIYSYQNSRHSGTPFQGTFPTPLSALQTSLQSEKHHNFVFSPVQQDRDALSPLLPRRLAKGHSNEVQEETNRQSVRMCHTPDEPVTSAKSSPLKEYDTAIADDPIEIPFRPTPTSLTFHNTQMAHTPTHKPSESAKIIVSEASKKDSENTQAIPEYKFEPPPTMGDTYKKLFVDVRTTEHGCSCKLSQCLKLYCECFRQGVLCSAVFCSCNECRNSPEHNSSDGQRQTAIKKIIARRPKAFGFKAKDRPHFMGCSCKKNRCLLKYCACLVRGKPCSPGICSCLGCKNILPQYNRGTDSCKQHE